MAPTITSKFWTNLKASRGWSKQMKELYFYSRKRSFLLATFGNKSADSLYKNTLKSKKTPRKVKLMFLVQL